MNRDMETEKATYADKRRSLLQALLYLLALLTTLRDARHVNEHYHQAEMASYLEKLEEYERMEKWRASRKRLGYFTKSFYYTVAEATRLQRLLEDHNDQNWLLYVRCKRHTFYKILLPAYRKHFSKRCMRASQSKKGGRNAGVPLPKSRRLSSERSLVAVLRHLCKHEHLDRMQLDAGVSWSTAQRHVRFGLECLFRALNDTSPIPGLMKDGMRWEASLHDFAKVELPIVPEMKRLASLVSARATDPLFEHTWGFIGIISPRTHTRARKARCGLNRACWLKHALTVVVRAHACMSHQMGGCMLARGAAMSWYRGGTTMATTVSTDTKLCI